MLLVHIEIDRWRGYCLYRFISAVVHLRWRPNFIRQRRAEDVQTLIPMPAIALFNTKLLALVEAAYGKNS
jgi:hypothetical protein